MNDIRFLNELGDNLEAAARRNSPRPSGGRRRRHRLAIALAVAAATATGIAAASWLGGSEELAANSIGCYETSDLGGNVTVLGADGEPPVRVCERVRDEQGLPPRQLVACVRNETVAVFPGADCSRQGLSELPSDYGRTVTKVERLGHAIGRIEASEDCIAPEALADRVRGLLERQGWAGWRVEVGPDRAGYPCGQITSPSGDGSRSIVGVLDTDGQKVLVSHGLPRSLTRELYGPGGDGIGGAVAAAIKASGERCHTPAGLMRLARAELSSLDPSLTFPRQSLPQGSALADARGDRYEEGCAVIGDIGASMGPAGKPDLAIVILRRTDRGD